MKFNEFDVGQIFITDPVTFTKEEIMRYASEFDQHYFHIDEKKAKRSIYGGLITSGLHLISRVNAEWICLGKLGEDIIAGLGIDNITWKRAVYPNDEITCEIKVLNKKLRSDNSSGIITFGFTARNQSNKVVQSCNVKYLIKC
jgi:acyl dehydratase